MFALCQLTFVDHGGGSEDDVTADHVGSPDRLRLCIRQTFGGHGGSTGRLT